MRSDPETAATRPAPPRCTRQTRARKGWLSRLVSDILFVVSREKKWWLLPLIVLVLALCALLAFAASAGPLSPFIYPFL